MTSTGYYTYRRNDDGFEPKRKVYTQSKVLLLIGLEAKKLYNVKTSTLGYLGDPYIAQKETYTCMSGVTALNGFRLSIQIHIRTMPNICFHLKLERARALKHTCRFYLNSFRIKGRLSDDDPCETSTKAISTFFDSIDCIHSTI